MVWPAQLRSSHLAVDAACAGTCGLLLVAPFERLAPIVSLPGQKITTVEAAIALALAAWGVALVTARERPAWRSPIAAPWIACLLIGFAAALAAPAFRLNALKTAARLAVGPAAALLAFNGISSPRRLRFAVVCAAAGGVIVAALAILEYAGVPAVLSLLQAFREGVRVVGGKVRAGGSLQYPTIASMYLEIVFALGLGGFLAACERRSVLRASGWFAALAIVSEGVIVTLTRAGLLAMAASLAAVIAWRVRTRGADRAVAGLVGLAAVIGVLVFSTSSTESLWLRLTTEGQGGWYRAAFLAPSSLSLEGGAVNAVELTVINRGRVTWDSTSTPPFYVSYHWFDQAMSHVVAYDGLRTPLPAPVAPGDSVRMRVPVRTPARPGRYTLGWDVVQEGRLWFSTEAGARLARSAVDVGAVQSGSARPDDERWRPIPPQAVRIGRPELWRAALHLAVERPVLGIGPDGFRLSYAPYVARGAADPRVTSNNTYLEVLTGTGVLGAGAFAWLAWRSQRAIRRLLRESTAASSLYVGVAAAVGVMALHGLVDSFLTLTPTYLLMSLTVGLAMAPGHWRLSPDEGPLDAHRV